jgi:hypothetical protein
LGKIKEKEMFIVDRHTVAQNDTVISVELPLSERERQFAVADILDIKDQQSRSSNVKADMSSWKLWHEMDCRPFMKPVFDVIDNNNIVPWNTAPIALNGQRVPSAVTDLWSAVYRKGDETVPHQHKPAVGAFVLYLQASGNSAPLQFPEVNPRLQFLPKNNLLVVFPAHLIHQVPLMTDNDERVVVAGNFVRTGELDIQLRGQQWITSDYTNG